METEAKLCCVLNPSYICSSCGFGECVPCLNKLPGAHFKSVANRKGIWGNKCSATGKIVKLQSRKSISDTWIWEEFDE